MEEDIGRIHEQQREFFRSGRTRPAACRREALRRLKKALQEREGRLTEALYRDLHKSAFEAYLTEIGLVYREIDLAVSRLEAWMRPRRRRTPWLFFPTVSRQVYEPYGTVLVFAPFNYPVQLLLLPLIGAVAAGNCVVCRQSDHVPHTAAVLREVLAAAFEPGHVREIEGGREVNLGLLELPFDFIFFTGGTAFGRTVLEAAARRLTPCTLELGGKSPALVTRRADVRTAARRIAWGKCLNAGQTCVAPDYVLVDEGVKGPFVTAFGEAVQDFFGKEIRLSPDYGRIVTPEAWERLRGLLTASGTVLWGGGCDADERFIEPTLLDCRGDEPVMREEIFGPLLPVVTVRDLDAAVAFVNARDKPLALYLFSESKEEWRRVLDETSSGGAGLNDTVLQAANPYLPFGGVGPSGLGRYHGRESFLLFSHHKGVVRTTTRFTVPFRYPPYGNRLRWIRKVFR